MALIDWGGLGMDLADRAGVGTMIRVGQQVSAASATEAHLRWLKSQEEAGRQTPRGPVGDQTLLERVPKSAVRTFGAPTFIPEDDDLVDIDEIEFPYSVELSVPRQTKWVTAGGYGAEDPYTAYSGGELKTVSFQTELHTPSVHFPTGKSLSSFLDNLRKVTKVDENLRRPPVFSWSVGDRTLADMPLVFFSSVEIIESEFMLASGEAFGDTFLTNRLPTHARVSVTLGKFYVPTIQNLHPSRIERDTYYVTARPGEEWEHIGKRIYGDPNRGDQLRRLFPQHPSPTHGLVYPLPRPEQLGRLEFGPYSIPLRRTNDGMALLLETVELMNQEQFVGA
jgi:hypothetical protein